MALEIGEIRITLALGREKDVSVANDFSHRKNEWRIGRKRMQVRSEAGVDVSGSGIAKRAIVSQIICPVSDSLKVRATVGVEKLGVIVGGQKIPVLRYIAQNRVGEHKRRRWLFVVVSGEV